jgi:HEAT repeat protein
MLAVHIIAEIRSEQLSQDLYEYLLDSTISLYSEPPAGFSRQDLLPIFGCWGEDAVAPLIRLMKDADSWLKVSIAKALGQTSSKEAIQPLIKLIEEEISEEDENTMVLEAAIKALGRIGAPEVIDHLILLLKDNDGYLENWASDTSAEVLGRMGNIVLPHIIFLFEEVKHIWEFFLAISNEMPQIDGITPGAVIEILSLNDIDYMNADEDELILEVAKKVIENMNFEAITDLASLRKWARRFPGICGAIADILGLIGSLETIPHLSWLLKHGDWVVRESVAQAFGRIGSDEAIPDLVEILKEDEWEEEGWEAGWSVIAAAINALGKIGSSKAIPFLIPFLTGEGWEEDEWSLRDESLDALKMIDPAKVLSYLQRLLEEEWDDEDQSVLASLVESIGLSGSIDYIPTLISLLIDDEQSWAVHDKVVEGLGRLGSADTIPKLIPLLSRSHSLETRCGAAEILGKIGSSDAIPHLIKLLHESEDSVVRDAAIEAIGHIGSTEALTPLLSLLDKAPSEALVKALGDIGSAEIERDLAKLLESRELNLTVIEVLGKIGSRYSIDYLLPILYNSAKSRGYSDSLIYRPAKQAIWRIGQRHKIPIKAQNPN